MNQVVITGVGVVSPFGVGRERLWDALAAGETAVRPIESFDVSGFATTVAAEVPVRRADAGFLREAAETLAPSLASRLTARAADWETAGVLRDRKAPFAVLAALEAWQQAGCGPNQRDAWLCLGLGLEQALLEDFAPLFETRIAWERDRAAGLPAVRFRTPVDQASVLVAQLLELEGPRVVHASACAAATLALAHAASLVVRGAAPLVLAGGADSMVNPLGLGGMSRLGATSPRNTADACRPFDRRRDGLAIGEGAALFVVEHAEHARRRGVVPLCRLLGWGSSQDAFRATAPRPDGSAAAEAMRRALERARLGPEAIDYINAHGTGTPLNDPAEARAIHRALGPAAARIKLSSTKGAIGHSMAAAGALELAASIMAFRRQLLPGTAHLENPDPECDLDLIGPRPLEREVHTVLKNSFGFGGQNACVILGSVE